MNLVEKKGSKIRGKTSTGMPGPSSRTSMYTYSPSTQRAPSLVRINSAAVKRSGEPVTTVIVPRTTFECLGRVDAHQARGALRRGRVRVHRGAGRRSRHPRGRLASYLRPLLLHQIHGAWPQSRCGARYRAQSSRHDRRLLHARSRDVRSRDAASAPCWRACRSGLRRQRAAMPRAQCWLWTTMPRSGSLRASHSRTSACVSWSQPDGDEAVEVLAELHAATSISVLLDLARCPGGDRADP